MSETLEAIQQSIASLRKWQIYGVSLNPLVPGGVRFDFTKGTNSDHAIEFYDVAYFSFSRSFGDRDSYSTVYEITLTVLQDGGREVLRSLGYCWRAGDDVAVNPSGLTYHLHIEGDICFDVVCTNLQVFKGVST